MNDSRLRLALSWVVTPFYIVLFYAILLFFHPLLVIAHRISPKLHKLVLEMMNYAILLNLSAVAGTRFDIVFESELPKDAPLIVVSNHQSMYDIPLFVCTLRRHHPKFIAKKELGSGLPSISFALRTMGSVLIDRSNQARSLQAIEEFGRTIERERLTACLFPEGTRARDGVMKPFKAAGFATLLKAAPSAIVVPVVLTGSWKLLRHNLLPIPYGVTVRFRVLAPVPREGRTAKELLGIVEQQIRASAIENEFMIERRGTPAPEPTSL